MSEYCQASNTMLRTMPSQYKCKICGQTWFYQEHTPVCKTRESISPAKEFYKLRNGMLVRVSEISYISSSTDEGLIGLRQHPVNFNLELEDYIALSKILCGE